MKPEIFDSASGPDGRPHQQQPLWRRAFPIDWPNDEYRSRRDFTRMLLLTSMAFVAGQLWIVAQHLLRKSRGLPPLLDVAGVDEIAPGGARMFDYPAKGNTCLLIRLAGGEFVAFGQKCTHLSCPVLPQVAERRLHCPCHHGVFDLETGCPLAGPPQRPLPRVTLEVRGGRVYATGLQEGVV